MASVDADNAYAAYTLLSSPDGIRWTERVAKTGPTSDASRVAFNPFRQKWIFSIKTIEPDSNVSDGAAANASCGARPLQPPPRRGSHARAPARLPLATGWYCAHHPLLCAHPRPHGPPRPCARVLGGR